KTRRKKTRPAPKRRIRVTIPRPTRAEALLLALAKDLASAPLDGALRKLADAFAPSAELPREVYGAWIKSRREKTTSLALSWARERAIVSRAPRRFRPRQDDDRGPEQETDHHAAERDTGERAPARRAAGQRQDRGRGERDRAQDDAPVVVTRERRGDQLTGDGPVDRPEGERRDREREEGADREPTG